MTRKDYIIIAEILVDQVRELCYKADYTRSEAFEFLIEPVTRRLSAAPGSFDKQKFRNYVLKKL